MYVYFCLLRKFKDGSRKRFVHFGDIISERDFNAVRELKEIGKKKNGQPLLKSLDFDNYLLKVQREVGADKLQIIDYKKVREQLQRAVANLPAVISKKSGKPRQSAFGKMVEPTPLNRIPLLPSSVKVPVLESRAKATVTPTVKPSATVQKSTARTKKPIAPIKPKLKLEKRRK